MPMNDAQFIANVTLPRSLRHFAFGACEHLTDTALAHIAQLYRTAEVPLLRFGVLHMPVINGSGDPRLFSDFPQVGNRCQLKSRRCDNTTAAIKVLLVSNR